MNIRNSVPNDHIQSISEIAKSQSSMIQLLTIENQEKDKEIEQLKKELIDLQNRFDNLMEAHKICDEENERLNNIIDKLESYLEHQYLEWKDCETDVRFMAQEDKAILNRLKELKEGK